MTARRRRAVSGATVVVVAMALTACSTGSQHSARRDTTTSVALTTTTTAPDTTSVAPAAPAAGCPPPAAALVPGAGRLVVDGVERSYLLALPDDPDPRQPTPVILNFHGSGSNMAEQAAYSRLPERGTARGYVVVTPDGTGQPRGWNLGGGADVAFVDALLAMLSTGICVDQDRIDAVGISNGSAFAALLACRQPYRIAAVGMVAATVPNRCPDGVRPAAIAFHGTDDSVVPYGGGGVNAEGARSLSAPAAEPSIASWAAHNDCETAVTDEQVGPDVVERTWSGCSGGSVSFYRIDGGGHTWPGPIDLESLGIARLGSTSSTVDATELMLDLFDRTTRSRADGPAPTTTAP
jgi:polyhydroxybutyrate depolymerase